MIFGLGGGITLPQTDYETGKIGFAFRGNGEYFFKTNSVNYFGLKLNIGYDQVTGEDSRGTISTASGPQTIPPKFSTGNFTLGLAATYGILIGNVFMPYLSGGVSNSWFDATDGQGQPASGNAANLYKKNAVAYNLEAGFKYLINEKVSLNLSVNQYFPQTDYIDDVAAAYSSDAYTTVLVGVSFSPFYNNDPDNDGVKGSADMCSDEPEDYDGFEDEDGCPDLDNDGDGILDIYDKCINEAEDMDEFEDEDGCPDLDNDGDGILDIDDKCINEAEDIDGVADEDGCPDLEELIGEGKFILMDDDIFSPNSAMIMVEGKKNLDEVIVQLKNFPDAKWRIEGHMDSNGNKRSLRNLSLERAKAVLEYFTYFGGLNKESFQVFGMGDNFPIADNTTEEGRNKNRRIEIIIEGNSNNSGSTGQKGEEFNQFILRGDDTFESNTATMKESAEILLNEVVVYIKSQPESSWKIEGYMDNQGSASLLKKLSTQRANTVYNYFISEGLSPDQFTVSGLGSASPIADNNTEEGRSANRRIILIRED
jgi:outer membrane protein OmpA-like peptidoglycan-associated protein/opacity protein-like surface antigen